ncbi:MAG: RidA family protein [Planctomycetota bacterium]|nr:RidA family protein [Planctomycetota bacterium]
MDFQRTFTNTPWEATVGYCRALRAGNHIYVTGTAPVNDDGSTHAPGDPYAQTKRCLEIVQRALADLGAGVENVVRTRMYVTDIDSFEDFGRAHREVFEYHPPCTTMVEVSALVEPDMLIEVEVDAVVGA